MSTELRLAEVQQKIVEFCNGCGRDPAGVTLIAVSKTNPAESIREAAGAGQIHFGENKVQELTSKMDQFDDTLKWHMIGPVQTNKIRQMAGRVDWIHSVSRTKELDEIEKRAEMAGRSINVLIQVNISDEDQKSGCEPDELPALLEHAAPMAHIRVRGLMGMASFTDNMDVVRSQFRMLREMRDKWQNHPDKRIDLEHLSMGMTNDMQVAIEEGATMIRVGTAIFGERNYS
ncbi:MAG: YggS family pyridoxal phosphate-dependent enzyme [Rhodothermaceae bacterium]|nr:YggS family pyridoxal phosphate-dependent enzyme [Rhodothermaceae bacterium]